MLNDMVLAVIAVCVVGLIITLVKKRGSSAESVGRNLGKPAPQVSPDPFLGLLSPHGAAAGHLRQTGAQNDGGRREPGKARIGPVYCGATPPQKPRGAESHPRILLRRRKKGEMRADEGG